MRVVFPEPDAPMIATISPERTERVSPLSTGTFVPPRSYVFRKLSTRMQSMSSVFTPGKGTQFSKRTQPRFTGHLTCNNDGTDTVIIGKMRPGVSTIAGASGFSEILEIPPQRGAVDPMICVTLRESFSTSILGCRSLTMRMVAARYNLPAFSKAPWVCSVKRQKRKPRKSVATSSPCRS